MGLRNNTSIDFPTTSNRWVAQLPKLWSDFVGSSFVTGKALVESNYLALYRPLQKFQGLVQLPYICHRENGGTLGMVPLIINPIYTLYSGYHPRVPAFSLWIWGVASLSSFIHRWTCWRLYPGAAFAHRECGGPKCSFLNGEEGGGAVPGHQFLLVGLMSQINAVSWFP